MSASNRLCALYRGDEFIDVGTVGELAMRRNVRPERIRDLIRPSYHSRTNYSTTVWGYWIEEDEEGASSTTSR